MSCDITETSNRDSEDLPVEHSYAVYFGDLHNHTEFSDGSGIPREAYDYARNKAGLDFFAVTDHCYNISQEEWERTRAVADSANEDDAFVALWGFEWTSDIYGHSNVIGTDDYCSINDSAADSFDELCDWLSTRNGVAFFNHPNHRVYHGFSFDGCSEKFVGMELWSMEDDFWTYYYHDGMITDDNNRGYYDEALLRGWRIGAAGGGDNHFSTWGTMNDYRLAVVAEACTRKAVMDALEHRRFYSTLDKNLRLSFRVDGREMGSTVSGESHTLTVKASDDDGESFTNLVIYNMRHDTVVADSLETTNIDTSYFLTSEMPDYFYLKVTQQDEDEAISSPVWVQNYN